MSRKVVEIPIEVWEFSLQDAEHIAALHRETLRLMNDNARLKAEVERLTSNTDKLCKHGDLEIERLKAENERLRKAGDSMAKTILEDCIHKNDMAALKWYAAKEGKQP